MKKLRVLLVDDEIMIREGFKRLFDWEAHDCEVVDEAADGMEALSKIDALDPDIVIMDINIPIMNGLKVIQLSRIKHPETAFAIVSGYDDFSYCREALRLQITDYILKPVNYEEFGSCIDALKITLFERRVSEGPEQQEESTITGITRYLQEHLAEDISLAILAEQFHLNAQYISQLFKSEIGVGFLTYLTNIRMEKAKKLLLSTALSIAEVVEQSGYGDYRVFTKVFKKTEGVTPSQYRRDFLCCPAWANWRPSPPLPCWVSAFLAGELLCWRRSEAEVLLDGCPCKRTACPRHGDCMACREYHHASKHKRLTRCEKLERKEHSKAEKRARRDLRGNSKE